MRGTIILLGLLAAVPAAAQQDSDAATALAIARNAIADVQAKNCRVGARALPERSGTGFAWQRRNHLVTALHVIAGCREITVQFAQPNAGTQNATVIAAMRHADLALLEVRLDEVPGSVKPLQASTPPAGTAWVYIYGYVGFIQPR